LSSTSFVWFEYFTGLLYFCEIHFKSPPLYSILSHPSSLYLPFIFFSIVSPLFHYCLSPFIPSFPPLALLLLLCISFSSFLRSRLFPSLLQVPLCNFFLTISSCPPIIIPSLFHFVLSIFTPHSFPYPVWQQYDAITWRHLAIMPPDPWRLRVMAPYITPRITPSPTHHPHPIIRTSDRGKQADGYRDRHLQDLGSRKPEVAVHITLVLRIQCYICEPGQSGSGLLGSAPTGFRLVEAGSGIYNAWRGGSSSVRLKR
jgi:hypothetical protein